MQTIKRKNRGQYVVTLKYVGEMRLQDKSGMWRNELSQKAALDIKQII